MSDQEKVNKVKEKMNKYIPLLNLDEPTKNALKDIIAVSVSEGYCIGLESGIKKLENKYNSLFLEEDRK